MKSRAKRLRSDHFSGRRLFPYHDPLEQTASLQGLLSSGGGAKINTPNGHNLSLKEKR